MAAGIHEEAAKEISMATVYMARGLRRKTGTPDTAVTEKVLTKLRKLKNSGQNNPEPSAAEAALKGMSDQELKDLALEIVKAASLVAMPLLGR